MYLNHYNTFVMQAALFQDFTDQCDCDLVLNADSNVGELIKYENN